MDIFALVRRRTLDVLAELADRGVPSREPGRVAVAVPRAGAPGDVVVDLGPVDAPPGGVADGLVRAPEVMAVAAIGGGRLLVTLRPATILDAVAAVLSGRSPIPEGRLEGGMRDPAGGAGVSYSKPARRMSEAEIRTPQGSDALRMTPGGRPQPARAAGSLADRRAEVLDEMRAALAGAAGRGAPPAVARTGVLTRSPPVLLRDAPSGSGMPPLGADGVLALIGAEAFRFAVASCRPGATLRLDLRHLGDRCRADPAFWVPYAHARTRSILRRAAAVDPAIGLGRGDLATADLSGLVDGGEVALARLVARHAQVVADAAAAAAPHRLALHLREVADAVHHQWNRSKDQPQLRFVNEERRDLTKARLGLVTASALVLRSGLGLLGLSAPDEML